MILNSSFFKTSCILIFFPLVVYTSFLFITKKNLIKKCVFIFCYIIFSQKTISNSSFVFTSLPNNGLCFTARKNWSHFSANSTFESSKSKSKETLFDSCIVLVSLCMHTWSSSNTCIFLILKSTLSRRIAAGFS